MNWKIEFHRNAEKEFDDIPKSFQEDFFALFREIRADGLEKLSKKDFAYIGDGIYELRVRNNDGIARSLYVLKSDKRIKILVVFVKKTQKTPTEKIDLAKRRKDDD